MALKLQYEPDRQFGKQPGKTDGRRRSGAADKLSVPPGPPRRVHASRVARTILRCVMDVLFAAVEQRDDPPPRGRSLAVGGSQVEGEGRARRGRTSDARTVARSRPFETALGDDPALLREAVAAPPNAPAPPKGPVRLRGLTASDITAAHAHLRQRTQPLDVSRTTA